MKKIKTGKDNNKIYSRKRGVKLMHRFMQLIISFLLLGTSYQSFAHGEKQPGPHQGMIRMPGAFHTEVIAEKNGFKVMLLDMQFKNPSIQDSTIEASIKSGKDTIKLTCTTQANYFYCPVDKKIMQQNGELEIKASRQKAVGAAVTYPLPLTH
jgi:hypothetical protein